MMERLWKRGVLLLTAIALLGANAPTAIAQPQTFTSGKDWLEKMNGREKILAVIAPMLVYEAYGVPFGHTAPEYVRAIDKILLYNPYLEDEDVSNLLASTVYAYEPYARTALRQIEAEAPYHRLGYRGSRPLLKLRTLSELKISVE